MKRYLTIYVILCAMVALALLIVGLAGATPPGIYGEGWNQLLLPNAAVTPGATVAITKVEVCETKWGKDVRHVTPKMKREVCQRYGAKACPGPHWEIDHLIPRELGGADRVENLWPQPIKEARLKDHLENWSKRAVCTGAMDLFDAQTIFRTDWTKGYVLMKEGP